MSGIGQGGASQGSQGGQGVNLGLRINPGDVGRGLSLYSTPRIRFNARRTTFYLNIDWFHLKVSSPNDFPIGFEQDALETRFNFLSPRANELDPLNLMFIDRGYSLQCDSTKYVENQKEGIDTPDTERYGYYANFSLDKHPHYGQSEPNGQTDFLWKFTYSKDSFYSRLGDAEETLTLTFDENSEQFFYFLVDLWVPIAGPQEYKWFTEALSLPPAVKGIISLGSKPISHEVDIKIAIDIQRLKEFQESVTLEAVIPQKLKSWDYPSYYLLNCPTKAALGPQETWQDSVQRFTIVSIQSLLTLGMGRFDDPRTRQPITSVLKVYFSIRGAFVDPLRVQKVEQIQQAGQKRRRNSFGGGKTFYQFE